MVTKSKSLEGLLTITTTRYTDWITMMKFASSNGTRLATVGLLLLAVVVPQYHAATQLDGFGTVTYEASSVGGMPLTVPINFKSDFPVGQVRRTVGDTWIEWTLDDDADPILYEPSYQNNDVVYRFVEASQENVATFTLHRTANTNPPVGETTITITVSLLYNSGRPSPIKIHERIYDITVTAAGTLTTVTTTMKDNNEAASLTSLEGDTTSQDITGQVLTPLPAEGITFTQIGSTPVTYGNPIRLMVSTADASYRIWLDTTAPIQINTANSNGDVIYTWPAALISGNNMEATSSNNLLVTLTSVPLDLYHAEQMYVSLKVVFRDSRGGRRTLRARLPEDELARSLDQYVPGDMHVQTSVQVAPMQSAESGSSTVTVNPLVITTTLVMAGLTFLI